MWQEPYLFGMALRAIGNLTRCDENIARVVGYGVIKGIVEGMSANADISSVIQLAADVMGNLGSLDDEDNGEGVATGARVLREGLVWRKVRCFQCACSRGVQGEKKTKRVSTVCTSVPVSSFLAFAFVVV